MEINAFNALKDFMSAIWVLFTGWHLPFTNVTPALIIFLGFSIKFLVRLTNSVISVSPIFISQNSDLLPRYSSRERYVDNNLDKFI